MLSVQLQDQEPGGCSVGNLSSFNSLLLYLQREGGSPYIQRKGCNFFPSLSSGEDWNQMQSQEEDVAITEQDLELIKERETAIRQLEVTSRSCIVNSIGRLAKEVVQC